MTVDQARYNQVAAGIAAKLHQAWSSNGSGSGAIDRSLDQLVPDVNRAALGVALEYERMGNQPVTADLAERATSSVSSSTTSG